MKLVNHLDDDGRSWLLWTCCALRQNLNYSHRSPTV